MSEPNKTLVLIKGARISYPKVFKPEAAQDDKEKKYSVCLLIARDDAHAAENRKAINAALKHLIKDAADKGKWKPDANSEWGYKVPSTFKLPLRDGDEKDDANYHGNDFINASSKTKPGLIDRARKPITEESGDFYPGCYAYVFINFYAFDVSGNKGIAAGLENIMKVKDGEKLAGKQDAETAFADVAFDDDDADDDLLGGLLD